MPPLPANISDSEIIAFVDRWVALLEQEDFEAALALTGHYQGAWTADAIREAIKRHGERVTLEGVWDGDGHHDKEVTRWPTKPDGYCGDIWYDLYVDGRHSDLTALFHLRPTDGGLVLRLIDIGVGERRRRPMRASTSCLHDATRVPAISAVAYASIPAHQPACG